MESYRLDSNPTAAYSDGFFRDNKYTYAPKIMAEANRKDGFRVLSLGYAEGPEEYHMKETLNGESVAGMGILMEDIYEAQELAGYDHYAEDVYPNRSEVTGLDAGVEYYFVLRARDNSERENEEKNQVVMTATPLK